MGAGSENYSLPNINYDDNGNILNLQRNGKIGSNAFGLMDNLTYAYSGNRLNSISDAISTNNEVDFVPRGNNAYTYYSNGALKSDANEQIANILYNTYLNQPNEVFLTDGRKIKHHYDGSGALFKTEYFNASGTVFETYHYIDGLIYKNGAFFQIGIPEGRVMFSNGNWQYEFDYKDHLGNTRVSFKADGNTLVQTAKTDFDPFGVVLKSSQVNNIANRFELQSKERDLTFGLNWVNFGARRMNPTIGRMDNIDALANKFASHSLYNYTLNNPLNVIDPDGNESRDIWGNTTFNGFVSDDGSGNFVGSTGGGDDDKEKKKESESSKKVKFKDSSQYDYSKEHIKGKGEEDWDYFTNGEDGNYFTRAWNLFKRDLLADGNEDIVKEAAIQVITRSKIPKFSGTLGAFEKMGKVIGKTPRSNTKQNKQFDEVAKKFNMNPDTRRKFHEQISKKGFGYHELIEAAKQFLKK